MIEGGFRVDRVAKGAFNVASVSVGFVCRLGPGIVLELKKELRWKVWAVQHLSYIDIQIYTCVLMHKKVHILHALHIIKTGQYYVHTYVYVCTYTYIIKSNRCAYIRNCICMSWGCSPGLVSAIL